MGLQVDRVDFFSLFFGNVNLEQMFPSQEGSFGTPPTDQSTLQKLPKITITEEHTSEVTSREPPPPPPPHAHTYTHTHIHTFTVCPTEN